MLHVATSFGGCAVAAIAASAVSCAAAAQDCPTAATGNTGFVVERTARQKTEVFHLDRDLVRTVMRYDGKTLLETVQFRGLFHLDRIDTGWRIKLTPRTDLQSLPPLKTGRTATAEFSTEEAGRPEQLRVELTVTGTDELYIGPCRYRVLEIDHSETRGGPPARFVCTDYYSPELKLVLGREYRERDGSTHLVKFDRIYPIRH